MMKLTERMAEAERRSGVLAAEAEWDRAEAALRAGTLDQVGFDLVHSRLSAARDRYFVAMRDLRAGV